MSKRIFVVSPDYVPKQFLEWFRLKMALQSDLGESIELRMPASKGMYHTLVTEEHPDLIFANPFDAGWLITESDYIPLAKPAQHSDEVVIFCQADSDMQNIRDIPPGSTFAALADQGIEMLGLRLLEAANLSQENLKWQELEYFQGVLRMVRDGQAKAGLMHAAVFEDLHPETKRRYRVLIRSAFENISHLFLVAGDDPRFYEQLADIFDKSRRQTRYYAILREIYCRKGFELLTEEDGLFLADVLETLKD